MAEDTREKLLEVRDIHVCFGKGRKKFEAIKGVKGVKDVILETRYEPAVVGRDARFFLGECFDPAKPKQKFDLYISVKPAPKGNMYLERMFVARVPEAKPAAPAAKK